MSKQDSPPDYTNRASDNYNPHETDNSIPPAFTPNSLEVHPPPFSLSSPPPPPPPPPDQHNFHVPAYFQNQITPAWTIVINNRFWTDGFRIFVSEDASNKFDAFKKSKNPEIIQLQEQGIGVPLFKAITSYIPLATKFITFRRYVPTNLHPFDIDKDYYDYCIVKRKLHVGYDSYIFEFTPDPKQPKLNFQVILFSHSVLPIHDYIYKGERHRWIDESNLRRFKELWQVKYGFKHTYLIDGQPALTDNWDGQSDKLNKNKKNPYLDNFFKMKFSILSRYPKPEYYGPHCTDTLGEAEAFFKLGYAELKIDDLGKGYSQNDDVNYESIFSIPEEELVTICIATVLKRQKDIEEEKKNRRRRAN